MKRAALASALSLRAKEKKLVVVDKLAFDAPKTKRLAGILKALGVESALVVDGKDERQPLEVGAQPPRSRSSSPPRGSTSTTSSTTRAW